ncbi:MAG: FAD synthetase family protein [Rhodobacterales bacterium]|uniref:FAD synthetase family protein n=1 Tax=Sulfitobacter sp. HI0054 TaxID=1822238 RepID=UPI0007C2A11C|nr:FAD synthetase family protein [Sulfitobacter sp. HI0054]KZY53189.1 FAD synthetase [Sulfitobacter sp. HI0054]MDX5411434.1 FAD synthetase family protein [Rhodobacterales bacterium]
MDFTGIQTRILSDRQAHLPASVMAIGAFDGVHRGHQQLIRSAVAEARAVRVPSVVWTFDPPPKVVFGRAKPLCSLTEKLARIAHLGPDLIVVARFDRLYAARSAEAFMDDLAAVNPTRIHVGHDFRFGHRQSGDTDLLATRFAVTLATPVACDAGETVSSTRIRALRAAGRLAEADALQGPFDGAKQMVGRLLTADLRFQRT